MSEEIENKIDGLGLKSRKPNCGVVAVAYIADKPLDEVTEDFRKICNMPNRWRGGTNVDDRNKMMQHYRINSKEVEYAWKTLEKWIEHECDVNKVYMVRTTGHAQIIENGMIIDQGGLRSAQSHPLRRKRIKKIQEIITP